jgi:hypothetical protein
VEKWHQFVVSDPGNLSGESVHAFMKQILEQVDVDQIFVSDVNGACEGLKGCSGMPLSVADFMTLVRQAHQYDWAFFFLYSRGSSHGRRVAEDDKGTIASADMTVRLADDTYFIMYTKMDAFASRLRACHPKAEYKITEFRNLWIPY